LCPPNGLACGTKDSFHCIVEAVDCLPLMSLLPPPSSIFHPPFFHLPSPFLPFPFPFLPCHSSSLTAYMPHTCPTYSPGHRPQSCYHARMQWWPCGRGGRIRSVMCIPAKNNYMGHVRISAVACPRTPPPWREMNDCSVPWVVRGWRPSSPPLLIPRKQPLIPLQS